MNMSASIATVTPVAPIPAKGQSKADKSKRATVKSDSNVTLSAVASVKAIVMAAIDSELDHTAKADNAGQKAAYGIMKLYTAYRASGGNVWSCPLWSAMVSKDHAPTDDGKKFAKRMTLDMLGKAPKAPSVKQGTWNEGTIAASRLYRNRLERMKRAINLAIAIGYMGGSVNDWNDKAQMIMAPLSMFLPRYKSASAKPWSFQFALRHETKALLNGREYSIEREGADGGGEYLGGKLTMTKALAMFNAAPRASTATPAKGADQEKVAQFDEATRKGVIATASFDDLMLQAAALLNSDKTAKPDPTRFKGDDGAALAKALTTIIMWRDATIAASLTAAAA
jgi:hypothetical protein